ncbi:MAG: SDR family oxidoreductase [Anaerolineales bacterium]|nr:SDR family oxidoreductase [Anaerolineales bacterium]
MASGMESGKEREVVVITGVGGMGVAIARRLGNGRVLVLADFDDAALQRVSAQLSGEGYDVHAVKADVSDVESVKALAEKAQSLGAFRAVVHTAGLSPVQASPERIVSVDVLGTAYVLEEFGKIARNGSVAVCIASMAGTMTKLPPEIEQALAVTPASELASLPTLDPANLNPSNAYGIAKRANQVRVQAASVVWGARGGRTVSISPGIISTPMGQAELDGPSGDMMRSMIAGSGVKRIGTPDDIAAAVAFLVSSEASFITGTDLLVDGGTVPGMVYAAGQAS